MVSAGDQFIHNWHLDAMAEYLAACQRREIQRLIINIPPRALKSITCSVAWPAWLLGRDPTSRIICSSYALQLSIKHSVDCRMLMQSDFYRHCFPSTQIVDDNNQKSKYVTTARGHRIATSTGGSLTGEGGDILIVDDPHKASDAQSKIKRDNTIGWFDSSLSTRLNSKKNGVILVIMQRLHEEDLTGHLLSQGGWEHLCLPAVFSSPKLISIGNFHRQVEEKEYLQPEREDEKVLEQLKKQLGSYNYAGQYLQTPMPDGGGLFKREFMQRYPADLDFPDFDCIIQSYDTALTDKTTSDPTAFTVWGTFTMKGKTCVMLIDAWQRRMEYPDLRRTALREWNTRYGPGSGRRADFVLIEEKGSGISLIQDMQRASIPIRAYNPGRADKTQRANLVTYLFENKLVYFPESELHKGQFSEMAEEVIHQLLIFPNGEHDDYVDSTTQALKLLRDMSLLEVPEDPEEGDIIENELKLNPYAS